ncbi:MAG: 3'(2'),5'-bisphosphate nucleotidase CysQ [Actinomycetota bacterium]
MTTPEDHELAARVATEAGALLMDLRTRMTADGAEASVMKDAGDQAAHQFIMETLGAARPDDAILSEEGADDLARLSAHRTWIVDPLDGTREYSEPPRVDWAVHIALVIDGSPVAGAVALPAEGLTLSTATPPSLPDPRGQTPRVIVSRTRRPPAAVNLAKALEAEYIEMGSAGAKAMAVVRGEADIYAHSGGQYEWDSCAPVAVATAAGLACHRLDGSPLVYNNENPYLPDLLICRPEWRDRCLDILAANAEADAKG